MKMPKPKAPSGVAAPGVPKVRGGPTKPHIRMQKIHLQGRSAFGPAGKTAFGPPDPALGDPNAGPAMGGGASAGGDPLGAPLPGAAGPGDTQG
jgi:hypothetical protein